jgi:hypothetical protein
VLGRRRGIHELQLPRTIDRVIVKCTSPSGGDVSHGQRKAHALHLNLNSADRCGAREWILRRQRNHPYVTRVKHLRGAEAPRNVEAPSGPYPERSSTSQPVFRSRKGMDQSARSWAFQIVAGASSFAPRVAARRAKRAWSAEKPSRFWLALGSPSLPNRDGPHGDGDGSGKDERGRERFAEEWTAAWNAHDLARVLSYYEDDFEMASPLIVEIAGEPSGVLRGKERIRVYWEEGLRRSPALHFEKLGLFVGVRSLVIHLRNQHGRLSVEAFEIGDHGRVTRAAAHYA